MNSSASSDNVNVPELILKLCNHLAGNEENVSARLYKTALSCIHRMSATVETVADNEDYVVSQIKQILPNNAEVQERFQLLHSTIKNSNILQHKCAALHLLLNLARASSQKDVMKWNILQEMEKLPSNPLNLAKSKSNVSIANSASQDSLKSLYQGNFSRRPLSSQGKSETMSFISGVSWSRQDIDSATSRMSGNILATECDLLQEVIYSFQGIEGKYLKKEPGGLGFILDQKASRALTPIQRGLVERLSGISFLHNRIKSYCEGNDQQKGILCQALISILRDELSTYYKTVALMQASIKKQSCVDHSEMTLRRALYVIQEHQTRLEWLAYIAEQSSDKKGGALVTSIHGFLQHGSKCVQEVTEKVLTAVCKPLYLMLSRWLLDGEINDPCNEFFIEARTINAPERMWHDKYIVRKTMVPSFMTMDQAKKILATGKSINFLRQICKDGGQLPGRECLQKLFRSTAADALFAPEQSMEFHATLENVYRETSLRVLDLLKNKFRLFEHLHALRRYLLLGQGDFIRHLLELLAPELNKPAQKIYTHTLSAILESAVRVTNAQYEDEDTLRRLNISFMRHSQGDTGWDVFSLIYIVDGPTSTIFQPTMSIYQCLFGALWKTKRIEFVLANLRKQQITFSKLFKNIEDHRRQHGTPVQTVNIKELKTVMHTFHVLTSEMIHFLHQTQYYFLFEVLECSWAEMLKKVNQAECLDDIVDAHLKFLHSVQRGVLLDEGSIALRNQLQIIYNFILTLESHQNSLYAAACKEREAYFLDQLQMEKQSNFGLTLEGDAQIKERVASFNAYVANMRNTVKGLSESYKSFVKNYLKMLSTSSNLNLQLLSVRLSFNDYYKIT